MEYLAKKKVTSSSIDEKDMINKFSQKGLSGRFLSSKLDGIPDVSDTGREASPNEEMEESKRKLFQSWYNENPPQKWFRVGVGNRDSHPEIPSGGIYTDFSICERIILIMEGISLNTQSVDY